MIMTMTKQLLQITLVFNDGLTEQKFHYIFKPICR